MHVLRQVDPTFWWDVAQRCSYTTFFHTPLWNEIARWYDSQLRDRSVGFIFKNGTRVVFPLLETKRVGPFRRLISTFEGTYGGLIADGPLSNQQAERIYRYMRGWSDLSFAYLANPLAPRYPVEHPMVFDQEETHIVHLDADFDTIFQRFAKNTRNAYRRGQREEVRVRRSQSLDDYRAYYAAYRDSIKRWGEDEDYGYRWDLFEYFYALERQHPEQITVWIAELDDQVVGGSITFGWNQHLTVWHASVTSEALKRRAMVVLDTEIIRDAIERKFQYYDLNTSAKIASVISYKQSLGATAHLLARHQGESWLIGPTLRFYRTLRYGNAQGDPYVNMNHEATPPMSS